MASSLLSTVSRLISSPFVGQTSRQTVDSIHYSKNGNIGGRAGEIAFSGNGGYGVTYQDRDNLKVDRSISAQDIPQMLNIAWTYELPFGAGKPLLNRKGVLNAVLGAWRLAGNSNAQSSTPLAITGPCDDLQNWEADDGCRVKGEPCREPGLQRLPIGSGEDCGLDQPSRFSACLRERPKVLG